jgi:hypothetical protein
MPSRTPRPARRIPPAPLCVQRPLPGQTPAPAPPPGAISHTGLDRLAVGRIHTDLTHSVGRHLASGFAHVLGRAYGGLDAWINVHLAVSRTQARPQRLSASAENAREAPHTRAPLPPPAALALQIRHLQTNVGAAHFGTATQGVRQIRRVAHQALRPHLLPPWSNSKGLNG